MEEIWKDIEGYEGLYQVSNLGRIKSLERYVWNRFSYILVKERILKQSNDKYGYCIISLNKNNKGKVFKVHRLVAQAFIPNSLNAPQVNHKDEDKKNNYVDNLEWCDSKYNNTYGTRIERIVRNRENKLSKKQVMEIYTSNLKNKELAQKYNVCTTTIGYIKTGKIWKNIISKMDI